MEIICRCLVVAVGVMVLGVSAKYSGGRDQTAGGQRALHGVTGVLRVFLAG